MAKRGRKKIEIDWEMVRNLAIIQCTIDEIAFVLGVNRKTLMKRKEFKDYYKKGQEQGKISLRRRQFEAANNGNISMLIWLGKQYLGQAEKVENNVEAKVEDNRKVLKALLEKAGNNRKTVWDEVVEAIHKHEKDFVPGGTENINEEKSDT